MIENGSPFWLRVHDRWVHLDGVAPGVTVGANRPGSTSTTSGGRVNAFNARRARRTWSLSYKDAPPEAVAALAEAAGRTGVAFLDESVARLNTLDPVDVEGPEANPVTVIEGVPTRSLTRGPAPAPLVRTVGAAASTVIDSGNVNARWRLAPVAGLNSERQLLLAFDIPPIPDGYSLTAASFTVYSPQSVEASLGAFDVRNAWTESGATYATRPGGGGTVALVGSTVVAGEGSWSWNLDLDDLVAARRASFQIIPLGDIDVFTRYGDRPPVLTLTYARDVDLPARTIEVKFTRPHTWAFGGYTDIPGNASLVDIPGIGPAVAPGTGLRPFVAFTRSAASWDTSGEEEDIRTVRVEDTDEGIVAGLRAYIVPEGHDPLTYQPPYHPGGRMPAPVSVGDVETELLNIYPGDPRAIGDRSLTITEVD